MCGIIDTNDIKRVSRVHQVTPNGRNVGVEHMNVCKCEV